MTQPQGRRCTPQTGHLTGSDHRWQECPTYHDGEDETPTQDDHRYAGETWVPGQPVAFTEHDPDGSGR